MLTYLTKRGSTYYFRRVVPHDLRERVGKSEFTFSLKTKDKAEAKRRCLEAAQQVQAEIDEASEANPLEPVSTTTLAAKPMSRAVTKALAYRAVQNRRRAAFQAGSLAEEDEHWRNQIDIYRAAMRGELDLGMTLDKLEGSIAGVEAALSGADDDALLARADQYLAERAKPPEPMGQMLDDILPIWALDRNPTPKTQQMFKATCVAFEEVAGRKPVGAYAPADIRAYVTKLREKGRSAATIESRLNHLRALFRQGIGQGWITTDPTASIKPPTKGDAKQVRRPFTVDELAAIFSSPVFKDSQRPKGGGGEAAFWLPLLALWTGARLNEIGQLRVKDIVVEQYLDTEQRLQSRPFIHIVSDEKAGLRLKNMASRRRIPVHKELISAGFIDYVHSRGGADAKLFPDLKPDMQGVITGNWSKWFSRYLREVCLITDKTVTFHSFRHTFRDTARACGIANEVADALFGHSRGNAAEGYGGSFYPQLPLAQAIDRYQILGFQIADYL